MTLECFMCHRKDIQLQPISYTSSIQINSDGIIQVCNDCYGVLFE